MGIFSRLFGHKDNNRGSNYYKREGFLSRIMNMVGSFSHSDRRYNSHHYDRNKKYDSHYSDSSYRRSDYNNKDYNRRKYRSSWS